MLAVYFGFISPWPSARICSRYRLTAGQPMSVGIPIGFGMFAFTFGSGGHYRVSRGNTASTSKMIAQIRGGEPS